MNTGPKVYFHFINSSRHIISSNVLANGERPIRKMISLTASEILEAYNYLMLIKALKSDAC